MLDIQKLEKSFGEKRAVQGLSFTVEKGTVLGFLGPNGAGKSTFFKLLLGSIKPDRGTIRFKGLDITRQQPHRRALMGIGMKFQNLGLYQDLSVHHNLRLPLQHSLSNEAMEGEITRLLERLGDPHRALPPVFHVAGTNGKGSTCAFLRAAMEADGKSVHVFTSPHLVRFNERIRIAGQLIDDAKLARYLERVLDIAEGVNASFFESCDQNSRPSLVSAIDTLFSRS